MTRTRVSRWFAAAGAALLLAGCALPDPATSTPTSFALPTQSSSETPTPVLATATGQPAVPPTSTPFAPVGCTHDGAFLNEELTPQPVAPGEAFTVAWRLGNTGTCAWQGVTLRFVGGSEMGRAAVIQVPPTAAGGEATVTVEFIAPEEEGEYTGVWEMVQAGGTTFGGRPYARIVVDAERAAAPTQDPDNPGGDGGDGEVDDDELSVEVNGCTLNLVYVADVTIPDDSVIQPGASFSKTWRLRNASDCDWSLGYRFVFSSGSLMGANGTVALPPVRANSEFEVTVDFIAPTAPGTYTSRWQAEAPTGESFGMVPFVRIVVPGSAASETPTPTATPES